MLGSCCASLAICVPLAGRSRECLPIGIIGGGDFLQVRPDVAASFQRRGESLGHRLQRSTFGCYISIQCTLRVMAGRRGSIFGWCSTTYDASLAAVFAASQGQPVSVSAIVVATSAALNRRTIIPRRGVRSIRTSFPPNWGNATICPLFICVEMGYKVDRTGLGRMRRSLRLMLGTRRRRLAPADEACATRGGCCTKGGLSARVKTMSEWRRTSSRVIGIRSGCCRRACGSGCRRGISRGL